MAPTIMSKMSGLGPILVRPPFMDGPHGTQCDERAIKRCPVTVHLRGELAIRRGHAVGRDGHGPSRTPQTSPDAAKTAP